MRYLNKETNLSGSYRGPQRTPLENSYALTDEQVQFLVNHNGFVIVTETPDPSIEGSTVTLTANTELWEQWKAQQPDPLEAVKAERIAQSKTDLAAYLETHPLTWLDGNTYAVTAEKQQQLTSKLLAATMAKASSKPYTLVWNTSGGICQEWTLDTLSALAFDIDAYVTPLVKYQQTQEVAMGNAATQEDLDAIVVDYDTVGAEAQEALR